jgi:hypothetical protein
MQLQPETLPSPLEGLLRFPDPNPNPPLRGGEGIRCEVRPLSPTGGVGRVRGRSDNVSR